MFLPIALRRQIRRWRWSWPDHRGLRFRLTLLFSLNLFGALLAFSIIFYRDFEATHKEEFDIALYNHAVDLAEGIDFNRVGELLQDQDVLTEAKIFPFSLSRTFMQIRMSDGRILAQAGPVDDFQLPFAQKDSTLLSHGRDSTFHTVRTKDILINSSEAGLELEDERFRLINFPLDDSPSPRVILQIAAPLTLFDKQQERLMHFFFLSIPLVLVVAAFGGFYLSGRALGPVRSMIEKAHAIGVTDLHERLPVPSVEDELRRLAVTMNGLLDRVERVVSSQERFVADASHQLMTPIAIMRGELDVVKRQDPEDVRRFLGSASQEIDRLARVVRDMLTLAKVDAGSDSIAKNSARLDELVLEAVEQVDRLARLKEIRVRYDLFNSEAEGEAATFEAKVDRDLFIALFQNLIENAIKYSPVGSLVQVRLDAGTDVFRLSVSDEGPGISKDDMPYLFERFYRGSRSQENMEGFGLGLAIAKRIADLHGAQLLVESAIGKGTKFTVELPRRR